MDIQDKIKNMNNFLEVVDKEAFEQPQNKAESIADSFLQHSYNGLEGFAD